MARDLGAEYMELVARAYHPDRSGDLQLLAAPFNSANYPQESRSLVPRDPRTSHASVWMYLERVPLVVDGPGIASLDSEERVSLADVAPTIAQLIGFDAFLGLGREGRPLPGIARPASPPAVVVTFVIDGGGWNVLQEFPDAWPNLRRLMGDGANFRNAIHGSFPAVTASAHATIGTGAFPRTHGVTGHNIRDGRRVRKTYGEPGHANPSDLLVPTLADLWSEATDTAPGSASSATRSGTSGCSGGGGGQATTGSGSTQRPTGCRVLGRDGRPTGLAQPERRALPVARGRAVARCVRDLPSGLRPRTPPATPRSIP